MSSPPPGPQILRPVPPTPIPEPIINRILPGGEVHLLSGASGTGKTALICQLLASALKGKPWFGLEVRPPNFIGVITSDRRGADFQRWLKTAELEGAVPVYSMVDDHSLSGLKLLRGMFGVDGKRRRTVRFELFEQSIEKLHRQAGYEALPWDSLIILDPASLFLGGNLLDYTQVFAHMFDLNQWCVRRGSTLVGLTHAGKQKGDPKNRYARPQDRILGSTAQTGCAGTTLHLSPPTETCQKWSELIWVPHHAPMGLVRLHRDEAGLFVEALRVEPTKQEDAALKVLTLFPDGEPRTTKNLIRAADRTLDLRPSTVMKYLQSLTATGFIEVVRRGVYRRRMAGKA